jgi:dipeptidyl aminopeptidase/acylaminoacyl peptidase
MTSERRFEQRELPELLEQLAMGPTPDYRIDIVQATSRTRQRPTWTFPGRWIPMTTITSRLAPAPRIPWRILVVAALLLALAVSVLLVVGSQRRTPPFGLAANGQVAYAANGDIYTVDPVTGASTAVITGPETDTQPVWSRDGAHFVFERKAFDDGRLFVASADGHELIAVTPKPLTGLANYAFSPDGREVMFISGLANNKKLWIAKADGSGARQLDVHLGVLEAAYRPPDGSEIVFASEGQSGGGIGLYAVDVKSGVVRQILAPSAGVGRGVSVVSPDGSRVAFSASTDDPDKNTYRVHVATTDGSGTDRVLPMPAGAIFQDLPAWSNDGTRLVVARGYAPHDEDMVLAVVPADGSGVGVETEHRITSCCSNAYEWAPDDSTILVTLFGFDNQQPLRQVLLDPVTGATKPASWDTTSLPAWQRRPLTH